MTTHDSDPENLPPTRGQSDVRGVAAQAHDAALELVGQVREAQRTRYRHDREISRGGMGAIHRVIDEPLARSLARKEMHRHLAAQRQTTEMFLREARLTGQLDHPNVVPVHELGVDENDQLYFTMKLVEGRTLRCWIEALPPHAPIARAELFDLIDVVLKVCDALAFAHSRGVLHCDVKPANVMVGEFGQVYLMDWGVARLLSEERARTESDDDTAHVVGTPTHMPPEQARGAPLDERADVFAVGALLYNVLTRRAPFRGEMELQVMAAALMCRYPHPDEAIGEGLVPPALTRIVQRAMAREPDERYRSVLELREDLLRFVRGGEAFEAVPYERGALIVREGEEGEDAFIIESGRCEVTRAGARIRVMGPGEVFGEMAILASGVRTASVRALEPALLRRVTAAAFNEELGSMKPWMGAFVRTLAERFRQREQPDEALDPPAPSE